MPPAKVFVTTPRKARTHAIRSLITSLSGMKYYEPNIQETRIMEIGALSIGL